MICTVTYHEHKKFTLKNHIGCIGEGGLTGAIGEHKSFDDAWHATYNRVERSGLI